jgi:hypothetical protein
MGVDQMDIIKMVPPRALVYIVVLMWVNFATLGIYVLRLAWRSLRTVFGSSVATVMAAEKTER